MHTLIRNLTGLLVFFALIGLAAVAAAASTPQVQLELAFGRPLMLHGGSDGVNYLKIGLKGFSIAQAKDRTPVNLAIVLDHSGSMQGSKLEHAKRAAIMAVDRLDRNDIVSVVVYDSDVEVLVPATKVTDRETIFAAIRRLEAGSNTALFAGVSKGAAEVRKFFEPNRVNRIILLSDGLANEGPSSPEELGELGASLGREGITVTTFGLGLGYNEDLMSRLARRSDGNHAFIERPEELARVFDAEFGDVLSVVAQEVRLTAVCHNLKPLRALGRDVTIRGNTITAELNQLYAKQEKYILIEVELQRDQTVDAKPNVGVELQYRNLSSKAHETITANLEMGFTSDAAEFSARENKDVMVAVTSLLGNENYKLATRLRDEGKVDEARKALESNRAFLSENARRLGSKELDSFAEQNKMDASNLDDNNWNRTRKGMRKMQHSSDMQQSY